MPQVQSDRSTRGTKMLVIGHLSYIDESKRQLNNECPASNKFAFFHQQDVGEEIGDQQRGDGGVQQ